MIDGSSLSGELMAIKSLDSWCVSDRFLGLGLSG